MSGRQSGKFKIKESLSNKCQKILIANFMSSLVEIGAEIYCIYFAFEYSNES